jgi:hypothetical protein
MLEIMATALPPSRTDRKTIKTITTMLPTVRAKLSVARKKMTNAYSQEH